MFCRLDVKIGGTQLLKFTDAGRLNLLIVLRDLAAAEELALHTRLFIDEEDHDMNRRPAEVTRERGIRILAVKHPDLFHEQLHALDLHLRAGETVEDRSVTELGLQHLAQ